jgi:hypothetical protein
MKNLRAAGRDHGGIRGQRAGAQDTGRGDEQESPARCPAAGTAIDLHNG